MIGALTVATRTFYIHKHDVGLQYGGSEEGGWWYDCGVPVPDFDTTRWTFTNEDEAYAFCRACNQHEHERQEREEQYSYSSVLSYRSSHYAYSVETSPEPYSYPQYRPHYE